MSAALTFLAGLVALGIMWALLEAHTRPLRALWQYPVALVLALAVLIAA